MRLSLELDGIQQSMNLQEHGSFNPTFMMKLRTVCILSLHREGFLGLLQDLVLLFG